MGHSIEIIPAVMPRDLQEFQDITVKLSAVSKWVHVDVMDGLFVPNISWPFVAPGEIDGVYRAYNTLKMEAHLMVNDPRTVAYHLIRRDFDRIIAHYESFKDDDAVREALEVWKASGVEAGLAITAETPPEYLRRFAQWCDFFHVMSIDPIGSQGTRYDEALLIRVHELNNLVPGKIVSVDGGMNDSSVQKAVQYGASRIVVGSAIMKNQEIHAMKESYQHLEALANSAV